jgi:hypothetical protein
MSAFGPKRTSLVAPHMSAFGGKADITSHCKMSERPPEMPSAASFSWLPGYPFGCANRPRGLKMQTLLVDLILAAAVGVVFLIARQSKNWGYMPRLSQRGGISAGESALAKFFALFWGWADYNPKDWSSASYKRGYGDERRRSTIKYR